MQTIGKLADRLLGLVAPNATVAALGSSDCWNERCFCSNHVLTIRTCCLNINHIICGGCRVGGSC